VATPTPTGTGVATPTPTGTGVATPTPTGTGVATPTPTGTGVATPTPTGTGVATPTPTGTGVATPTPTSTGVATPTPTGTKPKTLLEQFGGPTIETEFEPRGKDFLFFLKHHKELQEQNRLNISITAQMDSIKPEDFIAFKNELQKLIGKANATGQDIGVSGETRDSYSDVYAGGDIRFDERNPQQFTFTIDGAPNFTANLVKGGISITFNETNPSAQAIVAAAGILSDSVTMSKKVTALLIKDYQANPTKGLEIYCSLACQGKPVKFENEGQTFGPGLPETKVLEFLKRLPPEQRFELVRYEQNETLSKMVEFAHEHTDLTGPALDKELIRIASDNDIHLNPSATPIPSASQKKDVDHEGGTPLAVDVPQRTPPTTRTPPKSKKL
jgi:hypothetical protein